MSIVVYQCDTCKRSIELSRNINGLETVGRCVITHGCRGSLYQTDLYPDYVRGNIPDPVVGLDDWKQRKILHDHQQSIERQEWIIEHNMGIIPTVVVLVDRPLQDNPDNQEEIIPTDVIAIDDNITKLIFDRPWSGKAQLISKQSDPDLLRPKSRIIETVDEPIRISNNGEITIATRINPALSNPDLSSEVISVVMSFNATSGAIIEEAYSADDQPSLNSPWRGSDYDRIVVNVKSNRQPYTVRSYNALTPNFTSGTIDTGSTFQFIGVDPEPGESGSSVRDIDDGEILILLASDPYDIVDKITNQYIDVKSVSSTENPFGFFYNNGEFYATTDIVNNVFPAIFNIDS